MRTAAALVGVLAVAMGTATASADVPVPFSPVLENAYRPDAERIVVAARNLMQF